MSSGGALKQALRKSEIPRQLTTDYWRRRGAPPRRRFAAAAPRKGLQRKSRSPERSEGEELKRKARFLRLPLGGRKNAPKS